MSYKQSYWRRDPNMHGNFGAVRYILCKRCGKKVGGDFTDMAPDVMAKEMCDVARQHREATGHKEFYFGDRPRRS
jgi:hypothetical protein